MILVISAFLWLIEYSRGITLSAEVSLHEARGERVVSWIHGLLLCNAFGKYFFKGLSVIKENKRGSL
jgi:hypothetical protein